MVAFPYKTRKKLGLQYLQINRHLKFRNGKSDVDLNLHIE